MVIFLDNKLVTAAPLPAPSAITISKPPLGMVTFAPLPCDIIIEYGPLLPLSVVAVSYTHLTLPTTRLV